MEVKFFDNVGSRVVDDLRQQIKPGAKLQIAAASFSIYAFEALRDELQSIDELQFLFTAPTFTTEKSAKEKREFYIPKLNRERELYGTDFEIKLRNQLSQKAIARECAEWIRQKVTFKTNISEGHINGFLNLRQAEEGSTYQPFNEFTTTELGCERGNNLCPNIMRLDAPFSQQFLKTFDELWADRDNMHDVTERIIENIETVYRENSPEFIYFVTLYNIFSEFLEDINEDVLPNEATGFKNSQIWNKLYNFQRDAALAIINKLEKYNGCILADSVGLGKTFTALAVIKYYENRNRSVLVLCPKKLNENWVTFKSNYKNNPVVADRLRYDILYHSDLSRKTGKTNGIDLALLNWGNYDLIVIDESHNFRNGALVSIDDDGFEKENRYAALMRKVIREGVNTKVLMLSATPVNNRFVDLKNQLQLAYEGDQEKINGKLEIGTTIENVFSQAQRAYNKWAKLDAEERTTERLLDDLSFDFFQVLDAVTIARSRSHIVKYYDTADIGTFPTRLAPISRRPALTDLNKAINFQDIADMLNTLNLSIYTPSYYILPSAKEKYETSKREGKGVTLDGREMGMRKLMAIMLLKRLESSVNSFRLTMLRVVGFIDATIKQINAYEQHRSQSVHFDIKAQEYDWDNEDNEADPFIGKNYKIDLADMDYKSWRFNLKQDLEVLNTLLFMLKDITPDHDSKLLQLKADLASKFANPINPGNKKVLIFTAFADTANYLYEQLASYIKNEYKLNTAIITGTTDGKSTIENLKADFNNVLTFFSPRSKDKDVMFPNNNQEIDILIATDCISEGQNLQDCDYLINYDIHWNPVRIIQRFGRIDRIGSLNEVIQLVNYWPDIELDSYIKLKGRVESRMKATVLTSTGDDNLLSADEKGDLEYRKKQLKKLQEEVVDLEDMDTGVNIMDLGLNDFRMDLLAYQKDNPNLDHVPFGMSAVAASDELVKPGVMFILKNRNPEININHSNMLHPFYMVYLTTDGEVICDHLSTKKMLDAMRHVCKGKAEPIKNLCKQFNTETRDGRHMDKYSNLLQTAISSIIQVKEESDIESLFSQGNTTALEGQIRGLDDFELITFLVIK